MSDTTKKSIGMDMVNGPLLANMIRFSLPLMFSMLLEMLFNAADTIIVGKFAGSEALAAVGSTGSLFFLLVSLFNGLSIGGNVVVARCLGSRDDERLHRAVHTSYAVAIVSGLLMSVVGLALSMPLLKLIGTPQSIIRLSNQYMAICFAGCIFMVVYNFGSAILRSKGDTQRPLKYLTISGILNVVLNMIFVIVFHLSVVGVALATVISRALSAWMVTSALIHETDAPRLDLHQLKADPGMVKEMMRIGIPAGVQGMMFALSNVVMQSSINSFNSADIIAGNSAGSNIESFVYIGMGGFSQAVVTFTSQNIGADRKENIGRIMFTALALSTVFGLAISLLVVRYGPFFLGFYTDSETVLEIGQIRLNVVAKYLFMNGVLDIIVGSLRGMGYSSMPTLLMVLGICGFRLGWLWTVFPKHRTIEMVLIVYALSWLITSIVEGILWVVVRHRDMKQA